MDLKKIELLLEISKNRVDINEWLVSISSKISESKGNFILSKGLSKKFISFGLNNNLIHVNDEKISFTEDIYLKYHLS